MLQAGRLNSKINSQRTAQAVLSLDGSGGVVSFEPARKYFEIVSASLFSVERVLGQQFSNVGSFEPDNVAAKFKEIVESEAEIEDGIDKTNMGSVDPAGSQNPGLRVDQNGNKSFKDKEAQTADLVKLELDLMQTKLQSCVLRAKLN